MRRDIFALVLLATGCRHPVAEPEPGPVVPEAPPREPSEPASEDLVRRLEVGRGVAMLPKDAPVVYRGSARDEAWLAKQGEIEDIWLGEHICVRAASGVSCRSQMGKDNRIELPANAKVIDLDWTSETVCAVTSDGQLSCTFHLEWNEFEPLREVDVSWVSPVVDVEVHDALGCALLQDRSASCWLGYEYQAEGRCMQTQEFPDCDPYEGWSASHEFSNVRDIAVGEQWMCILDTEGTTRCLDEARDEFARVGESKFAVVGGLPPLIEIEGGQRHACGRSSEGEVWCWGLNHVGQLGDGTTQSHETPTPVLAGAFTKLDDLSLGSHFGCVLADGQVQCWGDLPDTPVDTVPTEIPGIVALELDVQDPTTCARVDSGWKCWGGSNFTPGGAAAAGRIVEGTPSDPDEDCRLRDDKWVECRDFFGGSSPVFIRVPASVSAHGSSNFGCVMAKTGKVHCWDELGRVEKKLGLPGKQVALGATPDSACALDQRGKVRCWAFDEDVGEAAVSDVVEVHGGSWFGCARTRAGAIGCWGILFLTADRDEAEPNIEEPLWLDLPAPAVEFGLVEFYGCARLEDGRVFCWGDESKGQRARLSREYATRPTVITMD